MSIVSESATAITCDLCQSQPAVCYFDKAELHACEDCAECAKVLDEIATAEDEVDG